MSGAREDETAEAACRKAGFRLAVHVDGMLQRFLVRGALGTVEYVTVPLGDSGWHEVRSWSFHSPLELPEPAHEGHVLMDDPFCAVLGAYCRTVAGGGQMKDGSYIVCSADDVWSHAAGSYEMYRLDTGWGYEEERE